MRTQKFKRVYSQTMRFSHHLLRSLVIAHDQEWPHTIQILSYRIARNCEQESGRLRAP